MSNRAAFLNQIHPGFKMVNETSHGQEGVTFRLRGLFHRSIRRFYLLRQINALSKGVIGRSNGVACSWIMRPIRLIGRILVVFLIPLSILSQVSNPCGVRMITITNVRRFLSILDLFLQVERSPIQATIVEIIFQAMWMEVRLRLSMRIGRQRACLIQPQDTMRTFRCSAIERIKVVICFWGKRDATKEGQTFRRLLRNLCTMRDATFIGSHSNSSFFVSGGNVNAQRYFCVNLANGFLSRVSNRFGSFLIQKGRVGITHGCVLLIFRISALEGITHFSNRHRGPVELQVRSGSFIICFFSKGDLCVLFLQTLKERVRYILHTCVTMRR